MCHAYSPFHPGGWSRRVKSLPVRAGTGRAGVAAALSLGGGEMACEC
jgi:hypothetical protein